MGIVDADPEEQDDAIGRLRFRDHAMDTLFGLWMPSRYAIDVEASVGERAASREAQLRAIGQRLADPIGQQAARDAFHAYVTSMDRYLTDLGIEAKPIRDRDAAFVRFLKSRTAGLAEDAFIARHARIMTMAPMFDVWQDPDAAAQFVQSFFDDLAWRARPTNPRRPRIVRSLLEGLGDDADWQSAEDLQGAFADRLRVRPWNEDEWQ